MRTLQGLNQQGHRWLVSSHPPKRCTGGTVGSGVHRMSTSRGLVIVHCPWLRGALFSLAKCSAQGGPLSRGRKGGSESSRVWQFPAKGGGVSHRAECFPSRSSGLPPTKPPGKPETTVLGQPWQAPAGPYLYLVKSEQSELMVCKASRSMFAAFCLRIRFPRAFRSRVQDPRPVSIFVVSGPRSRSPWPDAVSSPVK